MINKLNIKEWINKIIRFRFLIALVIFIIVVLLKLNGSSINIWDRIVTTKIDNTETSLIAGTPRAIRSDEWNVQTLYYLAQAESEEYYPVYNDNIRSDGQNMIIAYNAPVMDITVLSKPFNWGFLLLGKDYGLSWYWAMKTILLFLLSFEVSMILSKRKKAISLLGALWITLSPAVQWWFMQHVGDLILYMQAMIVSFYYILHYFNKIKIKILFSITFALSAVGFALVIYPAIQVPLAYLTLVFMMLLYTDYKDKIKIKRSDIIIIVCTLGFIILNLGHFVLVSKDAIKLTLDTVYPGKRVSIGGDIEPYFLQISLTNIFLPFKDINFLNNCEVSSFFNFLPIVLLSLIVFIKNKIKNLKYGIVLSLCALIQIAWLLFKFPTIFAKVTLLSYVPGNRMMIAFGITALYLSIWGFSIICELKPFKRYESYIISIVILGYYYLTMVHYNIDSYLGLKYLVLILLAFLILNYLYLRGHKKAFISFMTSVILISGITVNPLVRGTGAIYNKVLSQEIQSIKNEDKEALWAMFDSEIGGYLYANGVKTLNGVHFYPDLETWQSIDTENKYSDIYNRYAHVSLSLSNTTSFKLIAPDSISVNLTIDDIKKLNIKYILSKTDLTNSTAVSKTQFKEIYPRDKDGFYIFEVENK